MNLDKNHMSTLSTLFGDLHWPYTSLYLHSIYSACVVALVTSLAYITALRIG